MSFPIYATSPLPYALAGIVVLAASWRHLPRWLAVAGVVIEVALVLLTTPLGANLVVRAVIARGPPPGACKAPVPAAIVVLAGGFAYSPRGPEDYGALRQVSLERTFAGVALWRRTHDRELVMSGGGGGVPEAVVMANLAVRLGVPVSVVRIEDHSHSTWENARDVAALSPPVPSRIWLVTSPLGVPRALGAFRVWGFRPCAWRAGPVVAPLWSGFQSIVPHGSATRHAAAALHEFIGSLEYAVLAWRHAHRLKSRTR